LRPVPAGRLRRVLLPVRDGVMAGIELGPEDRPVDLVFLHANGFNGLTYRRLLAPLAERFRILAPDLRGHGRTTLPTATAARFDWSDLLDDVAQLLDGIGGPPVVLAGHSLGGTTAALAAAERPDRVARQILLDPVIWPRIAVAAFGLPLLRRAPARATIARNALRRRSTFPDHDTALKAYRGRGAFRDWDEATLRDYLEDGLTPADDGGLKLACDPSWEASNYAAQSHDPWRALARVTCPVTVIRAAAASTCRMPDRPSGLPHVRVETPDGSDHFFPMRRPDVARNALATALQATSDEGSCGSGARGDRSSTGET
jgi:pimeloyl-ACP methyl ester carboxylesterase